MYDLEQPDYCSTLEEQEETESLLADLYHSEPNDFDLPDLSYDYYSSVPESVLDYLEQHPESEFATRHNEWLSVLAESHDSERSWISTCLDCGTETTSRVPMRPCPACDSERLTWEPIDHNLAG